MQGTHNVLPNNTVECCNLIYRNILFIKNLIFLAINDMKRLEE